MLFLNILKNDNKYSFKANIKSTFYYVLYAFLSIIIFNVLLSILLNFFDTSLISYNSYNIIRESSNMHKPFEKLIFYTLIFAPIIEEIIFRLHLKFNNKNFLISLSVLIIAIIKAYNVSLILFYIFFIYAVVLIVIWFLSRILKSNNIMFKINIILSILFFGLSHISHIKIYNLQFWPVYLHYFIPLFIFGYYLSKIRLKLNIFYSVLAHFVFNLIPIVIMILN